MHGIKAVAVVIILCWACFAVQHLVPISQYGIIPRTPIGLIGIIASPFIHGSREHLIANTGGLAIFGFIFAMLERRRAGRIMFFIIVIQGSLTWLIGRTGIHVGASGLVFGLFGYLLCIGYFEQRFLYFLVSLTVAIGYGSLLFGVLPLQPGVSWEAHLAGLIAGILGAKIRP